MKTIIGKFVKIILKLYIIIQSSLNQGCDFFGGKGYRGPMNKSDIFL